MNPTEIKKVLGEYIDLVAKDGRLEFTIGQLELKAREYIATLDPLQHLFGSPLSQIEDMVEAVKVVGDTEKILAKEFLYNKGIKDTLYDVETSASEFEITGEVKWIKGGLSKLLDEYASQFKPLAAMPSDAPDFIEWVHDNKWVKRQDGWYCLKGGIVFNDYYATTAELYQQFLNDKK